MSHAHTYDSNDCYSLRVLLLRLVNSERHSMFCTAHFRYLGSSEYHDNRVGIFIIPPISGIAQHCLTQLIFFDVLNMAAGSVNSSLAFVKSLYTDPFRWFVYCIIVNIGKNYRKRNFNFTAWGHVTYLLLVELGLVSWRLWTRVKCGVQNAECGKVSTCKMREMLWGFTLQFTCTYAPRPHDDREACDAWGLTKSRPHDRTVWKTGQPPIARYLLQLLHFSSWRRKYVGQPNSSNINWYIYILFWVIFNPDTHTIVVYKRPVKSLHHLLCGWNVRSCNAT